MKKKALETLLNSTIANLNLKSEDLKKGREVALGYITGDIYIQRDITKLLPKDEIVEFEHNNSKLYVMLYKKFNKTFIRFSTSELSNDDDQPVKVPEQETVKTEIPETPKETNMKNNYRLKDKDK